MLVNCRDPLVVTMDMLGSQCAIPVASNDPARPVRRHQGHVGQCARPPGLRFLCPAAADRAPRAGLRLPGPTPRLRPRLQERVRVSAAAAARSNHVRLRGAGKLQEEQVTALASGDGSDVDLVGRFADECLFEYVWCLVEPKHMSCLMSMSKTV